MADYVISPTVNTLTVSPTTITVTSDATPDVARFDPSASAELYSDFVADVSPFSVCTGSAGSSGTSSYAFNDPPSGGFGLLNLLLAGLQAARIGVYASNTDGVATVSRTRTYGDGWSYDWKARVRYLTGLQYQRAVCGFNLTHGPPSTTLIVDTGAAFVARGSSGTWSCVMADANVMTETATTYSVDQFRTLQITLDGAGDLVRFYIDGTLVHSAVPGWDENTLVSWGVELRDKASGGSGSTAQLDVDFMHLKATATR